MSFQDKSIQCSDCGTTFTFSTGEQEFFARKGFTNDPRVCAPCRQIRKSERPVNSGRIYGAQRQMFPAICAECGKETEVPFEPHSGKPVYCSECYNKVKVSR